MGNGFYGCQTAASWNTLDSEAYGWLRNCLKGLLEVSYCMKNLCEEKGNL